ncbi:MAG TPA: PxKF domain-containing protein [Candidatus Sulfotelmatobacter sp.]|nr:PxKF domain-containing protein [Candidatus Sulfotelmatobacter sp.]
MLVRRLSVLAFVLSLCASAIAQVASQNINMVSGTNWPAGDPYLQRQNEPSIAVSSRNPEHMLGGANDYRTVDIPNPYAPNILGDAWLGVYSSLDGGETWKSTLLPGYPQDTSPLGTASPLHAYTVATDPTVRAGTNGMFYYSGLAFNRGTGSPSGVFVATFQDLNNKGNGDSAILQSNANGTTHGNPFQYIGVNLVDTGTSGQFLDKPWIAVDIPRPGRTATCTINGKTFSSGYVYVVYTQFNGSQNNPASKIKVVSSTNCGATWNQPQVLSQAEKLAQGTVATIDPSTGNVIVAWRQIAVAGNQNQPDAIQYAISTNGGVSFSAPPPAYTFVAPTTKNPYPPGSVFDQPQASGTTFRTLDVPSLAVDGTGRVWLAFSQRFNGPTAGTYGSRIMISTLPKGSSTWTTPYVADGTAPTASTYGHQFMPSLNFAYGKLMLAWFDSRRDNLQSVLQCANPPCNDLSQVTVTDQAIPGSTLSSPATVFTPLISDPSSGVRHTIDVFGAMINPAAGPATFKGFQISQYPYYVDDANGQIEQGFFNPPNLPMFVQGTIPFIGDYIDIAAQTIMPSGNSWAFNSQATDSTGATNAPDFHIAWTDNRDVVPPPVRNGSQDWTLYVPPNGGNSQVSTYSGTGAACPTCMTVQPACTLVNITNADGTPGTSTYSGDRNQNVYTSRISNGLVVRFRENAKVQPANTTAPAQRSYSLLVKNTTAPLGTTPPGSPTYYRVLLGETSTSQGATGICSTTLVPANFPGTPNCYLDLAINPKTTLTEVINVPAIGANSSINLLVAQIACIPGSTGCGTTPSFVGLQAVAVLNGDITNPSLAEADFLSTDNDNPDVEAPYQNLPIAAGEEYNPTVDAPPDPTNGIFTPKISVPAIFTPKIGTVANSAPAIETPTIFTPKITSIFTPKIASIQVANPTIVDTIFTPKIFTPKIFTPKIVSPDIFTPKITNLAENSLTDYSWKVNDKGNTSASYSTSELVKAAGVQCCPASCSANPSSCSQQCSVCQLVQHKVYESPVVNRDSTNMNPTCDLTVQQNYITVANIPDPAFSTGTADGSPSNPSSSTLSLSPGEGNRVTLRVVAPPVSQQVGSFKTEATPFTPNTGQAAPAGSLVIITSSLPVAVVGQHYTNTAFTSIGGFGADAWTVPADPSNPVAVLPPPGPNTTEPLPVTPLTLNVSGQISTSVVTAAPGTYTVNVQVQDSAATGATPTPALDVQQVPLEVNQFTITSVDAQVVNEAGSAGYMKAGDVANVAITVTSTGPANATNVIAALAVNPTAAGTPSGPPPVVTCAAPMPLSAIINGTGSQIFTFTCTATSGNGYVTFTAGATGHYVNPAADVLATATTVTVPPTNLLLQVTVDTVPPTLSYGGTTTSQSAPGWYNSAVVIPYSTADNLSGVASAVATSPASATGINGSGNGAMTLTTEGQPVTGVMTVTDYARNTASPFTSSGFNIDRTPPTISGAPDRAPDNYNWYNAPVTVTFSCNDPNPLNGPAGQQSGVHSCTAPIRTTAEGTNLSASGTAVDNAANSANTTVGGINVDMTPPTIGGSPDRPANANHWYNAPVIVSFVCADPNPLYGPVGQQSGIASCPLPTTLSSDGAAQSVPGATADKASNASAYTVSGINIDQTPPAIATNSTYTPNTWTNQSVTVTFTCTDNLSGPVVTGITNPIITGIPAVGSTLSYSQPNALTSTATVTLTANTAVGGATLNASCQDLAGNNATPVSFGPILIDTTPPTVTATANLISPTGPVYTSGTWVNQSVVVTFACSDALSGVKPGSITGSTSYASQGSYNANGSCQDNAGNTGTGSFGPVLIDTTTPAVLITSPVTQTYLLNQQITPSFTCGDNSGGDATTCTANPSGSPYTASAVGPATFSVHGVDQAGNITSPDPSVSYLVTYNFTGFQPPLLAAVMLNPPNPATPPQPSDSGSFTVGSTIPVAWQLQDATNTYISDLTTLTSIVAVPNPACAGTVTGAGTVLYNATTGQNAFSYDNTNSRFVFNWNTTGTVAGCYNLIVTTNDTAQWSTIVHLATDTFAGLDAPLANASAPSNPSNSGTFDTGSTIPVMFELITPNYPAGPIGPPDTGQNVNLNNVTVYANAACSGAPQLGAAATVLYDRASNTGSFGFNGSTAVYSLNWATGAAAAGCYNVVVTLSDQSVYATMVTLAAPGGVTTLLSYNFDNVAPGSLSAAPSYTAPNVTGGAFGYSRTNINGVSNNGCAISDCFNVSGVSSTSSDYYAFSLTNGTAISNASISFWEFNNDCHSSTCPPTAGPSFVLQYDADPTDVSFSNATTVASYTPPEPGFKTYSFPVGNLPAGTYNFRFTVLGTDVDGTGQYVFDNVNISGSH